MAHEAADEWVELGTEAHLEGKVAKANRCYRSALRIDPNHGVASCNLAITLAQDEKIADAMLAIDRAVLFDPEQPLIWANRCLVYLEAGYVDEALVSADKAMALTPDLPTDNSSGLEENGYMAARLVRAVMCGNMGHPGDGIAFYRQMLVVDPKNMAAGNNICFAQSLIDSTPKEMLAERTRWYKANTYGRQWKHDNDREMMRDVCNDCNGDRQIGRICNFCNGTGYVGRPLRVGYVSGDYKIHSAAMIFSNVILNHNRDLVEPFLYCTEPTKKDTDHLTQMFMKAGTWRELHGVSDIDADDMIRTDKIDILVDLSGHTNGGRLKLFTMRPAPIQVCAWGFALGTGLPEMDYFFADKVSVPECDRQYFSEQIYDVPCIMTYRPPVEYNTIGVTASPLSKNGYVTFGCFGRYEKISDEYLQACAQILRRVPNSRFWLKDHAYRRPHSMLRIWNAMPDIDRKRIIFGGTTSHPEHLLACQAADLFLDSFPHTGGVGSLEMMYMGVPIVTKYGNNTASRLTSSLLAAMGRGEWITHSAVDYVNKAVEMAMDPKFLGEVRQTLRQEFLESPVVNGYHKAVEDSYRLMWRKWCAK